MRNSLRKLVYLARASLLLAALLYLVGGVAGSSLHSHWTGSAAASASLSEPDAGVPLPDAERGCFVCQILGAAGLPAVAVWLPEAPVRLMAAASPVPQSVSHREPAPSRARAPPALHSL